jgi:GH24 family phage-related lysozyme (muramidase)
MTFDNMPDLMMEAEGFEPEAYKCPKGKLTVGRGKTEGVTIHSTMTKDEANEYLIKRFESDKEYAKKVINV